MPLCDLIALQGKTGQELPPPLLLACMAFALFPLLFINRIGQSYRLRHVAFPTWWALAAGSVLTSLVLWVLALGKHDAFQMIALVPMAIVGFLCFGLPVIHRLSGFRPVEFEVMLNQWPSRAHEQILGPLSDHLQSIGMEIQPPERWKCDLAAIARVRGTTNPDVRIRYAVMIRLESVPKGMRVMGRVDEMDICIRDTGESRNCMVLAQAIFQRFDQDPFVQARQVVRAPEHVRAGA